MCPFVNEKSKGLTSKCVAQGHLVRGWPGWGQNSHLLCPCPGFSQATLQFHSRGMDGFFQLSRKSPVEKAGYKELQKTLRHHMLVVGNLIKLMISQEKIRF